MTLWLIRHGMTKGNQEHRYVGATNEGLLSEEKERLQAKAANMDLHPTIIFVSPARRCRETAACLFLGLHAAQLRAGERLAPELIVVPEFMEMNFGAFEYKTYQEINADPDPAHRAAYQHYIDTNGEAAFPGGESKAAFTKRVCEGFERAVLPVLRAQDARPEVSDAGDETTGRHTLRKDGSSAKSPALERSPSGDAPDIAIVAHGGTIMALMERYAEPHKSYFEWSVKPGEGYRLDVTYRS